MKPFRILIVEFYYILTINFTVIKFNKQSPQLQSMHKSMLYLSSFTQESFTPEVVYNMVTCSCHGIQMYFSNLGKICNAKKCKKSFSMFKHAPHVIMIVRYWRIFTMRRTWCSSDHRWRGRAEGVKRHKTNLIQKRGRDLLEHAPLWH